MNQKETKQVVETQESKEKWLSQNEVLSGGLEWQPLVDCWLVLEVALVSVSSPPQSSNNQQFSQPVQTGQNQGSNQQQNSQNSHASQGNQQNGGPQDGGPQGGGPQGGGQGQGGPQGGGPGQMPQEGNGGPQGNGQIMA